MLDGDLREPSLGFLSTGAFGLGVHPVLDFLALVTALVQWSAPVSVDLSTSYPTGWVRLLLAAAPAATFAGESVLARMVALLARRHATIRHRCITVAVVGLEHERAAVEGPTSSAWGDRVAWGA